MDLCPNIALTTSKGMPLESAIVVAKVWRAEWNVMRRVMPTIGNSCLNTLLQ